MEASLTQAVNTGGSIARFEERRAMSIADFVQRYGVGRSKTYLLIKSGEIPTCKVGTRTLIRTADAEAWLNSLPAQQVAS